MNESPRLEFDFCDHPSSASSKVLAYLDTELRANFEFSVESEYPSVFGEYPGGESLHCSWDGEIVSHVALVARHFIHPLYSMRVGLIGSVVTSEAFRGRGLGRALIDQAVARLRQKGCAVVLLWSDRDGFYQRSGFVRAGMERTWFLDTRAGIAPDPTVLVPFDPQKHLGGVWRLYSQKNFRFDRSLEEQRRLVSIPRTKVYVAEHDGKVAAYLAVNKGADFPNYIHEWGGDPSLVSQLVLQLTRQLPQGEKMGMIAPWGETTPFGLEPESNKVSTLAWMKVLDPRALRAVYFRVLKASDTAFRWDSFAHTLHLGSRRVNLASAADHAHAIFGAGQDSPGPVLPFFVWGWDSI